MNGMYIAEGKTCGVDDSPYSANNAIMCYNSDKEELYGKVILDNAMSPGNCGAGRLSPN